MQHHLKHIPGRLVPLDKNPGWRLIDVGKVFLIIIAGKVVMSIAKDGVTKTEAVDAENAFPFGKSQVSLHKIKHICPPIATSLCNCFNVPAKNYYLT